MTLDERPEPYPEAEAGTRRKRNANTRPVRPGIHLSLACVCGSTMRGTVSPATAAIELRDVYMAFHRRDGCAVTDTSKDTP